MSLSLDTTTLLSYIANNEGTVLVLFSQSLIVAGRRQLYVIEYSFRIAYLLYLLPPRCTLTTHDIEHRMT